MRKFLPQIAGLLFGIFSSNAASLESACAQQRAESPHPALVDSFINSVGINIHLDAKTTSYANAPLVLSSLTTVGIRYIRDDALEGGIPFNPYRYQAIVDSGIKVDLGLGDGNDATVPEMYKAALSLERLHPGSVTSVEGYNEVNEPHWAVTFNGNTTDASSGYYQPVIDAQTSLYQMVHGDPHLNGVRVLNFSLANPKPTPKPGDDSRVADYANVHAYPVNGSPPARAIEKVVQVWTVTHGLPVIVTETGYPTVPPEGNVAHDLVDERVQAAFLADTVLDNFSNGIFRTYIYELLDRRADPSSRHVEWHFGIFRYDGTPKPAAGILSNLFVLLRSNNVITTPGQLRDLTYSLQVSGNDGSCPISSLLFQKAAGLYDFVYWGEPRIWDGRNLRELTDQHCGSADLSFLKKAKNLQIFDPIKGRGAVTTITGRNSISSSVSDHPIIVQVQF